jgi:hypothetical protein
MNDDCNRRIDPPISRSSYHNQHGATRPGPPVQLELLCVSTPETPSALLPQQYSYRDHSRADAFSALCALPSILPRYEQHILLPDVSSGRSGCLASFSKAYL